MVSAVVLTRNSAPTLARTLESLAWCAERIVIDDGSTDKTIAIAKAQSARVYTHALDGDFASQRNFGLSKATQPWILFVDSDEVIPEELRDEIREAVASGTTMTGYRLSRTDFFMGRELKYGETAHVSLVRLGRKGSGVWVRAVHETWNLEGAVGQLKTPILHYPHPTLREFIGDINAYSTLNAIHFYREGKRVGALVVTAYPVAKFLKDYFWLQGYRDGTAGAVMALMMSFHSFLTRGKMHQLQMGLEP